MVDIPTIATWPKANSDTGGEFAALPAMTCGSSTTGGLNGPIRVDSGKFRREHYSNMEFATSINSRVTSRQIAFHPGFEADPATEWAELLTNGVFCQK